MMMQSLTPVLMVEEIEPCLEFWVGRLGFEVEVQVPEGDRLGFVKLVKGGATLMYQTRASVKKDVPALAGDPSHTFLYVVVDDLEDVISRLKGCEAVIPTRDTFYGAREHGVREPAGNVVTFARFAE